MFSFADILCTGSFYIAARNIYTGTLLYTFCLIKVYLHKTVSVRLFVFI